ncbi:carboxymuconolactone decarboxylase family protein [Massilia antarctica]|uniref:Carboxymuconolactone decarboxylase family protein n=1 Tax=Massilia antarctica TaxID=2765360 RepID=A0AA48WAQ5_9BURK|nr:carboxymuconolactone decarboxylase family protein [Massilia antarctica]QPI47977.1 carboxymuconolactone decarboxylase family protein [Massilia antarctica]
MSRIALLTRDQAHGEAARLLDQVQAAFGAMPNMFRAVANSPAALASMWAAFGALGSGTLGARLGEQIAVAIADQNNCEYCLAAHTALGRKAGASSEEMTAAQAGTSHDPKTAAALAFALKMVRQRARIDTADVDALRQAGFDDAAIMEIMAHIALNLFTNYVNVAFAVPLDFPRVALRAK